MSSLNSTFAASLVTVLGLGAFSGCQVATSRDSSTSTPAERATTNPGPTLVDPKYSLSKDRTEFDKLRESIPTDVKKTNDEKALTAEWFADVKADPDKIRDKYDSLVRKKRDLFSKNMTKARETFNKDEQKKRADFLKDLDASRKEFLSKKSDREKRNEFFNDQDEKRKTFFAEQKDKREDFEGDIREKRKDFDDYLKDKSTEFNLELKAYRIKWKEKNPHE